MAKREAIAWASRLVAPVVYGALGLMVGVGLLSWTQAADKQPAQITSQIVRWDQARVHKADWGEMRFYYTGETGGSQDVLVAVGVVEPGKAVHKAHRHAAEEYLVIAEGTGIWNLDGKQSPAKKGDVLYTAPWVYHGFTNTGDGPLVFFVVRHTSKGVPVPPRPDSRPDEL